MCPFECGNRSCTRNGQCCDENCLTCSDTNPDKCTVCRHLSIGDFNSQTCVKNCTHDTYRHVNRRCITKQQCRDVPRPTDVNFEYTVPKYPYIPFEGQCLLDCPTDYYPEGGESERTERVCKLCQGKCKKTCLGSSIESIATAQRYRGCTFINGSLTLQIRSQGGRKYILLLILLKTFRKYIFHL